MEILGKRLNILADDEIERLFERPKFSQEDRAIYFSLSQREREAVYSHRSLHTKMNFILQLGYFKAKSMFFVFDLQTIKEDAQYILTNHFSQHDAFPEKDIPHRTRVFIQNKILQLFNYRLCDQKTKVFLQIKANQLAKISTKPIHIFNELVKYLENQSIVLPGYSFFQEEIVGRALTHE